MGTRSSLILDYLHWDGDLGSIGLPTRENRVISYETILIFPEEDSDDYLARVLIGRLEEGHNILLGFWCGPHKKGAPTTSITSFIPGGCSPRASQKSSGSPKDSHSFNIAKISVDSRRGVGLILLLLHGFSRLVFIINGVGPTPASDRAPGGNPGGSRCVPKDQMPREPPLMARGDRNPQSSSTTTRF